MKLIHHIAVSSLTSGILFAIFKSWGLSLASLCSGILIDLDHVLDYIIEHNFPFNSKNFFPFFYREQHTRIRLIFHGWEWLLCLGIIATMTDFNPWITGALIGYGVHIVSDYFYSKANLRSYSLLWRWINKFDSELIFPRNRGYDPK